MPIKGKGWELHIVRRDEQVRAADGRRRTVGSYQVYHDAVAQAGPSMTGMVAETKGPGSNSPAGNGRRVEAGRYPLWTQDGTKYVTWGYLKSIDPDVTPKPGIELKDTGDRREILIHPGHGYLSSVGCINPCSSLPNANELINYVGSRQRVIDLIDDMKAYLGGKFPKSNGKVIPTAFAVIDGEPPPA